MATSTRLTGYSIKHPIIEYQNRYSVTRKTFFYENNDKIFRTLDVGGGISTALSLEIQFKHTFNSSIL
jgi:hypothetical protein